LSVSACWGLNTSARLREVSIWTQVQGWAVFLETVTPPFSKLVRRPVTRTTDLNKLQILLLNFSVSMYYFHN
jgi:hypothetical protein